MSRKRKADDQAEGSADDMQEAAIDAQLSQRKDVSLFFQRRIEFRESIRTDTKMAALRQKYKPINVETTAGTSIGSELHGATHEMDLESGPFTDIDPITREDVLGFRHPSRVLFSRSHLRADWEEVKPTGAGLRNMGHTDYLNATLQCLTYTPPLSNWLLQNNHSSSCTKAGFCGLCELERHVNQSLDGRHGNVITPNTFVSKIKIISKDLRPGRTEDAGVFLRDLILNLHLSSLPNKEGLDARVQETTLIYQIFGFYLMFDQKCPNCGKATAFFDPKLLMYLNLTDTIEVAVEDTLQTASITSADTIHCSTNISHEPSHRTFYRPPAVLTLHLNRFDAETGNKSARKMKYGEYLDLTSLIREPPRPKALEIGKHDRRCYKLFAIIVHEGTGMHSGHYVAFARGSNESWYKFDDEKVSQVSLETVLRQQAYILFYRQPGPQERFDVPLGKPKKRQKAGKQANRASEDAVSAKEAIAPVAPISTAFDGEEELGEIVRRKDVAKKAKKLKKEAKTKPEIIEPSKKQVTQSKGISAVPAEDIGEIFEGKRKPSSTATKPLPTKDNANALSNLIRSDKGNIDDGEETSPPSIADQEPSKGSEAISVSYNDPMDAKKAALEQLLDMEKKVSKSTEVKRTIFGIDNPTHNITKAQFGDSSIEQWADADNGAQYVEDGRREALAKIKGKKKSVDRYDLEYDRGKTKKVKKKRTDMFDGSNRFQKEAELQQVIKSSFERRKSGN
ncbi:hypothetical protein BZG36_01370 [Bifiguratus adelaidae]|uniref:ubiquitinyl hydrolase 1 n=1 Tax=Bifiguratus adelaidae TaxID=1938954 RepID=A0A261Y3A9_9FUNG|nr:hypothetical protein BZG36_01370 [Bifiguratus adelaidae]